MNVRPRGLRTLARQIREDWEVSGRDWRLPGFRALALHRIGTWLASARKRQHNPLLWLLWLLYLRANRFIRDRYGIELTHFTRIGRRVRLLHQSGIVIHGAVVIGDECVVHQNVTLGALGLERSDEAPTLGRDVRVGTGAVIVGPVTIGDGARIGPNCVVMTDVPAGATVFVSPPRMLLNMRPGTQDSQNANTVPVSV